MDDFRMKAVINLGMCVKERGSGIETSFGSLYGALLSTDDILMIQASFGQDSLLEAIVMGI